jgi:hypothetical protein
MSQKNENMAGGISYRTLEGINPSEIFKYLDGADENSSNEILIKIKDYYVASADKIKFRILLAKKRVEHGFLDPEKSEIVDAKISESLKWLEDLKTAIRKQRSTRKFLEPQLYKQWHVIKLVPSAVEGLLLTSLIKINIDHYDGENHELPPNIESLTASSEKIFIKILDLTEKSDLEHAEKMRIDAYNKIGKAGNLLSKYKKIHY